MWQITSVSSFDSIVIFTFAEKTFAKWMNVNTTNTFYLFTLMRSCAVSFKHQFLCLNWQHICSLIYSFVHRGHFNLAYYSTAHNSPSNLRVRACAQTEKLRKRRAACRQVTLQPSPKLTKTISTVNRQHVVGIHLKATNHKIIQYLANNQTTLLHSTLYICQLIIIWVIVLKCHFNYC